jgi:hypothetical protein
MLIASLRKQMGVAVNANFFKGVALGAVVSGVTLVSSVALAGTGVGGVFNLGKSNSVGATTTLTGSTKGAQLQVTNSSKDPAAAGVAITVSAGTPPIKVSSNTKVRNLNADSLDGQDSTAFQHSITGGCGNGTAIAQIASDGSVTCSSSAILAIAQTPAAGTGTNQAFFPSHLLLFFDCSDPATAVTFHDNGSIGATLNWMFSQGGTTSTVNATGSSLDPGTNLAFVPTTGRLEGQWIYADAESVTTVNLHLFDGGSGCEVRGTVEIAANP